jgi:hypothetical protein
VVYHQFSPYMGFVWVSQFRQTHVLVNVHRCQPGTDQQQLEHLIVTVKAGTLATVSVPNTGVV